MNEPDEKELLRTVEELNRRITIFSSYMFEIFQVLLSCAEKLMALLLIYIIVALVFTIFDTGAKRKYQVNLLISDGS